MNQYKPEYLGKVIPAEDPSKLTNFVVNQYDSFSKVYDCCKEQSEKIDDIKAVDAGGNDQGALSVKIQTDSNTMSTIAEKASDDPNVKVQGNTITANV